MLPSAHTHFRNSAAVCRLTLLLSVWIASIGFAQPTTVPADVDPQLWQQLASIDARGAAIKDIAADFEQQKFTALLKKPLISKGTVLATSSSMLWSTVSPQPTQMHITESAATLYYPKEKLEEIYPVTGQLGSLAASPLPRLSVLQKHFRFAGDSVKSLDPGADETRTMAVKLTPIDASLREHVEQVRVLLDIERGFMIRCEITDSDGDRTVISFSNVRTNTGLDESKLIIHAPADVKVVRPLEKLAPTGQSQSSGTPRPSR